MAAGARRGARTGAIVGSRAETGFLCGNLFSPVAWWPKVSSYSDLFGWSGGWSGSQKEVLMPENDGLSLRAYGRHRSALGLPGGTLAGVKKALQTGRISLAPGGGIDPAIADPMWAARTMPRRPAAVLPGREQRL